MIKISKDEAEYMRSNKLGYLIHVSSATHKSKAKRYYMTEDQFGMKTINKYRRDSATYTYQNNPKKKAKC